MARQSLVVVESAAKAKTIEKFLGRDFMVRACLGHVRDLPKSKLGVDVEHEFRPQYVVTQDRKDVVKRLKDDARGKTSVLLATDVDREREIQVFVPVEYWTLQAELSRRANATRTSFTASLVEREGTKIDLKTGIESALVEEDLRGAAWSVAGVREREQQRHPDAPF